MQVSATTSEAEDDAFEGSDSSPNEDELEESESDESELEDEDTDNNVADLDVRTARRDARNSSNEKILSMNYICF